MTLIPCAVCTTEFPISDNDLSADQYYIKLAQHINRLATKKRLKETGSKARWDDDLRKWYCSMKCLNNDRYT